MTRPTSLTLSALERRDVPATVFGNPWPNADGLTMSFASNGVEYSNQTWGSSTFTSNLFSELNGSMTQSVWQEELLRAVYAWTAQTNVNVGLITDSGRAFGPSGFSVSSPSADLRVGAFDQSPEVLATSIPYHPLTGYHAGNMMLNGAKTFTKGGGGRHLRPVLCRTARGRQHPRPVGRRHRIRVRPQRHLHRRPHRPVGG